jgi:hypothetical protein
MPIGPQSLVHRPQFIASVSRFAQRSPQATLGAAHASVQAPSTQVRAIGQSASTQHWRHAEPQSLVPGGHWQRLIMQRPPGLHAAPHAPQCKGFALMSTHPRPHRLRVPHPVAALIERPPEQIWSLSITPSQPPQCKGSL